MSDDQAGDGAPRIHRTPARKRRARFNPGWIFGGLILLLGGAGVTYLIVGPRALPVQALPGGRPSIGEAQACWQAHDIACAEADYIAYLKAYPNDGHANASL